MSRAFLRIFYRDPFRCNRNIHSFSRMEYCHCSNSFNCFFAPPKAICLFLLSRLAVASCKFFTPAASFWKLASDSVYPSIVSCPLPWFVPPGQPLGGRKQPSAPPRTRRPTPLRPDITLLRNETAEENRTKYSLPPTAPTPASATTNSLPIPTARLPPPSGALRDAEPPSVSFSNLHRSAAVL